MVKLAREYRWEGSEVRAYKDSPGAWEGVTRQVLSAEGDSAFEMRYFEIIPGGFSNYEQHQHEHCVVIIRGSGSVRLDDEWHHIGTHDTINIAAMQPHQFRNDSAEPLGFLCVVDKVRDKPIPISSSP